MLLKKISLMIIHLFSELCLRLSSVLTFVNVSLNITLEEGKSRKVILNSLRRFFVSLILVTSCSVSFFKLNVSMGSWSLVTIKMTSVLCHTNISIFRFSHYWTYWYADGIYQCLFYCAYKTCTVSLEHMAQNHC